MISILMPINKKELDLEQTLESIKIAINNCEVHCEFIVTINNCSSDVANAIRSSIKTTLPESKIFYFASGQLGEILNYGLEQASFNLIARVDSDDLVIGNRFQKQYEVFIKNPDLVLLGGQTILIDERNRIIGRAKYPLSNSEIKKQLRFKNCFAHPTVMFKREEIIKIGGYRDIYPFAEDFDLWVRISVTSKVGNLPDSLIEYRIHDKQVSSSNTILQLLSTICILAEANGIASAEIKSEFARFLERHGGQVQIEDFLKFESIKSHLRFRATIALMLLRRSRNLQITPTNTIKFLFFSILGHPLVTLKVLLIYFVS